MHTTTSEQTPIGCRNLKLSASIRSFCLAAVLAIGCEAGSVMLAHAQYYPGSGNEIYDIKYTTNGTSATKFDGSTNAAASPPLLDITILTSSADKTFLTSNTFASIFSLPEVGVATYVQDGTAADASDYTSFLAALYSNSNTDFTAPTAAVTGIAVEFGSSGVGKYIGTVKGAGLSIGTKYGVYGLAADVPEPGVSLTLFAGAGAFTGLLLRRRRANRG